MLYILYGEGVVNAYEECCTGEFLGIGQGRLKVGEGGLVATHTTHEGADFYAFCFEQRVDIV